MILPSFNKPAGRSNPWVAEAGLKRSHSISKCSLGLVHLVSALTAFLPPSRSLGAKSSLRHMLKSWKIELF